MDKKCAICGKDNDWKAYCSNNGYWCSECAREVCQRFNSLVDGDLGRTTTGADVGLGYIKRLLDMLRRDSAMARWVIDDERRLQVLGPKGEK